MQRAFYLLLVIGAVLLHGMARAEDAERARSITVAFTGDVFIDAPIRETLERWSYRVGRRQAYQELLEDVAPVLRSADLALVNLESPVCPRYRDRGAGESPTFNAPPELLEALADAGVEAVSLANNHAYDQGLRGLRDTVDQAHRAGVTVIGVGRTPQEACGPTVFATPLGDVAVCAWTQGFNRQPSDEEARALDGATPPRVALLSDRTLASCLARASERAALVIASIHWTSGEWREPGRVERATALAATEAGADIVVGHGPHRPGPVETVRTSDGRSARIFFSLGNLIGAMGVDRREWTSPRASVRDALVAVVEARPTPDRRLEPALARIAPFWISDELPQAPWASGGRQGLIRPLSVGRELERLELARCGVLCDQRAEGYRRRLHAMHDAVTDGATDDHAWLAVVSAPATGEERAAPPARVVEHVAGSGGTSTAPPVLESTTPPIPQEPETPRDVDPALAPLLSGIVLPLRFRRDQVAGEVTDEAELRRIVALVQANRRLRIQLTGTAVEGETGTPLDRLAWRRARAASWEISGRGPSRSRFVVQAGPPAASGEGRVSLRLIEP